MTKEITIEIHYIHMHIKKIKEFVIHIVPNRFTVDYAEYITKAQEVLKLNVKFKLADTAEKLQKIELEFRNMDLQSTLDLKYKLIETLMIANDYEFDLKWWDTKIDPLEIENMIAQCALKDKPKLAKKKVPEILIKL